jgi:hypothetical protein
MANSKKQEDTDNSNKDIGYSDNIAGYKIKEFSDYLGDDLKKKEPYKSPEKIDRKPEIIQKDIPLPPKQESLFNKKMFMMIAVLIFCGILIFAYINHHETKTSITPSGATSKNPSGLGSSSTNAKNPLTNNGSIDSQLQYCSNPVNAENNC